MRSLSILKFEGNEAHSNFQAGLKTYILNPSMTAAISRFENVKLWRNRGVGASIRGNMTSIEDSLIFGNGAANVRLQGNKNTIINTRILGEISGAPIDDREFVLASSIGIAFWGEDNLISDSLLEGHVSTQADTGSDVRVFQDSIRRSTMAIQATRLLSERTIIFGHPRNGDSFIHVDSDSLASNSGLLLFRLDVNPPVTCAYSSDAYFMANVCDYAYPPSKPIE